MARYTSAGVCSAVTDLRLECWAGPALPEGAATLLPSLQRQEAVNNIMVSVLAAVCDVLDFVLPPQAT